MKQLLVYATLACCLPIGFDADAKKKELTEYTANSGAERTQEQLSVSFEHADLQLRIDPRRKRLDGTAALTFRATTSIASLVVDLDRDLPIASIAWNGTALAAVAWKNPEGRLTINLPQPLAKGERGTVTIVYGGKPHVARFAPWDGGFVWAKTPEGQPWIATAVQGEGCDLFWPCIDHPMGEPDLVDLHITVPSPLVAASNGVAMGMEEAAGWRTYHWRTKNPDTYAIALNIAPYKMLSAEYHSRFGNTIPLRFWYLPSNEAKAKILFEEFSIMLDFFESTLGPYPFGDEKMGVAETPHLGMEHQTINAYGNSYKKTGFGFDELLQHEFAHEWFGNQLTNTNWDDMWLHEGFGTYMQPLYMQWLRGDQEYFALLQDQRISLSNKAPLVSNKPMREEDVYSSQKGGPGGDIYAKGAMILHTLRELIGDKAFFASLRRLVYGNNDPKPGQFKPRYGSTREFIALVNEETGRDYQWFFDVYLYRATLPELIIQRDGDGLNLSWKTQDSLPFPMPVQVRIDDQIVTLPMTGNSGHLNVATQARITVDPHSQLLRQLPHVQAYLQYRAEQRALREKKSN